MRKQGYITMLNPLQNLYGERMSGLLFLPALCGEIFWIAAILSALCKCIVLLMMSFSLLFNLDKFFFFHIKSEVETLFFILFMDEYYITIILSTLIAVFFGVFYSVAYYDVIQLLCIFFGMWISIPFAWKNDHVSSLTAKEIDWIGKIDSKELWNYIDYGLLFIFGGIPWQRYFQCVLSSKTYGQAQILSYVSAFGCILMAIPAISIGAIAKATCMYFHLKFKSNSNEIFHLCL